MLKEKILLPFDQSFPSQRTGWPADLPAVPTHRWKTRSQKQKLKETKDHLFNNPHLKKVSENKVKYFFPLMPHIIV